MSAIIPSKNLDKLQKLIGSKIISVKRQIYKNDMDLEDFLQNADGPIELQLDNDTVLHFQAFTEANSVSIAEGKMPHYGESYIEMNVSNNYFWQNRLEKKITQIYILKSKFSSKENPMEFGIEILFENNKQVFIEYVDEEDYPDTIRLKNKCDEPTALRIEVQKI